MAYLTVRSQDGMYHISSQEFCLQFPDTEKNTRVLWLLLRAFHDPDTGKPVFTHEQIAKAFGYKHRQNIQNFEHEFNKCGKDLLAWRKSQTEEGKKFDAPWAGLAAKDIKPEATYQVLIDTRVAGDLEPDGSYRNFRLVPGTTVEAVKQRFLRRHVRP